MPENTPIANPAKIPNLAAILPKDKMATNYKTTMCKFFEEGKVCKYKENCSYAHGDHEIRTQMDNAKVIANQQLPCSAHFDPMKQPQIAFMMRLHQMAIITERLQEYFAEDFVRLEKVKQAKELLKENKIDEASPVLQVFVVLPETHL